MPLFVPQITARLRLPVSRYGFGRHSNKPAIYVKLAPTFSPNTCQSKDVRRSEQWKTARRPFSLRFLFGLAVFSWDALAVLHGIRQGFRCCS